METKSEQHETWFGPDETEAFLAAARGILPEIAPIGDRDEASAAEHNLGHSVVRLIEAKQEDQEHHVTVLVLPPKGATLFYERQLEFDVVEQVFRYKAKVYTNPLLGSSEGAVSQSLGDSLQSLKSLNPTSLFNFGQKQYKEILEFLEQCEPENKVG